MGEEHFDLPSGTAGHDEGIGLRDFPSEVACPFVDRTRDIPARCLRAAARLEGEPPRVCRRRYLVSYAAISEVSIAAQESAEA